MGGSSTGRRRFRRVAVVGGCLLLVLVLVVALLPTLVSKGAGHGMIRSALDERLNGTAEFDALAVSWFGPQRIEGLRITDASGRDAADLSVTVDLGLLGAVFSGITSLDVTIEGALRGELYEDGSTSFASLLADDPADDGDGKDGDDGEGGLAGVPAARIRIVGLDVSLTDVARDRTIALEQLEGNVEYMPGGVIKADLACATRSDEVVGALALNAVIDGLTTAGGMITPTGATVEADLTIERLPLPLTDREAELETLRLELRSDNLAERLVLDLEARTRLDGADASVLEVGLTATEPVTRDGTVNIGLANLTGTIAGRSVPTVLVEPFLANLPLTATRDLGELVDIDASFSPGESKDFSVTLRSAHVELALGGTVDPRTGAIDGSKFDLTGRVHPQLLEALAGLGLDHPAEVVASFDHFVIPAAGDDGTDLTTIAVRGTVEIASPLTITLAGAERSLAIDAVRVGIESESLGQGVHVTGTALVEGGVVEIDERITGLFDADGNLSLAGARPVGTITVRDVPGAVVAGFLDEPDPVVTALLDDTFTLDVATTGDAGGLDADIALKGSRLDASLTARRTIDAIEISGMTATVTVTPELAAAAQAESDTPTRLLAPAVAVVALEPFSLRADDETGGYAMPVAPVTGRLEIADARFKRETEGAKALQLSNVVANLTTTLGATFEARLQAVGVLRRVNPDRSIADLDCDLTVRRRGKRYVADGAIDLTDVSLFHLEQALGQERGLLSDWIGKKGSLSTRVSDNDGVMRIAVDSSFPNLSGEFVADVDETTLAVTAGNPQLKVTRAALERILNPATEDGTPPDPEAPGRLTVRSALPLTLAVHTLEVPLGLLMGDPYDPGACHVDIGLAGGPLTFANAEGVKTTVTELMIDVDSADLARGVTLKVAGDVGTRNETGAINVDATVTNLITDEGVFGETEPRMQVVANASHVPTALLDAFAGLEGVLTAAVGAQMNLTMTADDFSADSGRLEAKLETTNGRLETRVTGGEKAFHIATDDPLTAELAVTPELGQRLLYKVHPILADIRTTDEPIRARVGNVLLPRDDDTSRLNADIEITIGEVEFSSGSVMLQLLKLANSSNAETIPGYIEPIRAQIRNGVVTYERFTVRVNKIALVYTGQIDLNTNQVDLRTELPFSELAKSVKELEAVEGLVVPIVTRGTFGNLKTEIDPDYDFVGEAAKSGVKGLLDDALGDLFGGKKD